MADDGIQPAPRTQMTPVSKPEGAIRAGAPGTPDDVVHASRIPAKPTKKVDKPPEVKDSFREIIETIVFVIVLVFMLKTFLAEAFVIPTGSMATTLLGYHKDITCKQCRYEYKVNCATEAEEQQANPRDPVNNKVTSSYCPNCRFNNPVK